MPRASWSTGGAASAPKPRGITVNVVVPDATDTPFLLVQQYLPACH